LTEQLDKVSSGRAGTEPEPHAVANLVKRHGGGCPFLIFVHHPHHASESLATMPPAAASCGRDYTGNHGLVNGKCRMTATQWRLAVHGVAESWRWPFPGYFKPAKDQVIRHRGGSKGQYISRGAV
jgi:hypothetical protein